MKNYYYETNYSIFPRMVPAEDDIDILRKLASNKEITLIYEEPPSGKKIVWDKKMKVVPKPIEIAPANDFDNVKKEFPKLKESKLER